MKPAAMKSLHVDLDDTELARTLAGAQNENLKLLERRLGVRVGHRGTAIHLSGTGEAVGAAARLLESLTARLKAGRTVYREDVEQAIKVLHRSGEDGLELLELPPILTRRGRPVAPHSVAQRRYVDLIKARDVVFSIGPAGTGKTYLAMAMAVSALQEGRVKRIVLARPAVEAGEKLGFLPGDLAEKVNPYLRPLYDALFDMMDAERASALIEAGVVEVAPLAFMRGRTLTEAFAILDEAQNTTVEQMKMFLTRLGTNSKAVVTGDVTQIDLPPGRPSGLVHARRVLADVEAVGFAELSQVDVVRHPIVQDVILAYERAQKAEAEARAPDASTPAS
jgi:phosphate starvation-inducible protein PhoH and related proteins